MPVQVSYPGVYVQEVPSGVRTITGVSTSIAAFIGMTKRGRLDVPTRVLSFADYERAFGNNTVISEMTDQVRQFFLNGGQQAFITRIANIPGTDPRRGAARVSLSNEDGQAVLNVFAKDAGVDGNLIRLEVDYHTPSPESTFNLRAFRPVVELSGQVTIQEDQTLTDLSMDPASGRYVVTIVNQQSGLIEVETPTPAVVTLGAGYSLAGVLVHATDNTIATNTLNGLLSPTSNSIQISVDGSPFVAVVLPTLTSGPLPTLQEWANAINLALNSVGAAITVQLVAGPTDARYVEFRSLQTSGGSVVIRSAPNNDVAVPLQLGVDQGGIEVSGFAALRPAPNGFFSRFGTVGTVPRFTNFAGAAQNGFGAWTLTDASAVGSHTATPIFAAPGSRMYSGTASTGSGVGSLLNVRENLQILADSINAHTPDANGQALWRAALQGYRLVLRPQFGDVNSDTTTTFTSNGAFDIGDTNQLFEGSPNVASYSLGSTGSGSYQTGGANGQDGGVPATADYTTAFTTIDRTVDLFNLMILPRGNGQSDPQRDAVWGPASTFCLEKRAFLLVDPRSTWTDANTVVSQNEIRQVRIGLATDHAAIYWPRLTIATNGSRKVIDPSGSIAGVMARTDANRGVWKAPAGIEATIRGSRGVEYMFSDPENGLINREAVNAIRVFPNGIVSWGARTMVGFDNSGNDDYKYVPVRRIALFIEESLVRGLKFAVFEPNDEPLWAQIRLAAGAFMNNLFRQGAFQGQKARDAYFVKVDSETTTQNDINLGIVNVVVGFAPLKPAEFVIISLQQMAGQVQT